MNKLTNHSRPLIALAVISVALTSWATVPGASHTQPALSDFIQKARASHPHSQPVNNSTLTKPDRPTNARLSAAYGKLPLSFEANQGQTDKQVKFLSRGSGYTLFLTATEAVLELSKPTASDALDKPQAATKSSKTKSASARTQKVKERALLRMKLVGANPATAVAGIEQQPGKVNYFRVKDTPKPQSKVSYLTGKDVQQWRSNVNIPTYAKVQYKAVYPGVDMVYYGNQRQLEYDFVVAPNADPSVIKLAFEGVQKMRIDARGDLVLQTAGGEIRQHKPVIYQTVNGFMQEIAGRYVIKGNQVGFSISAYDASKPLVIDPVLSYSTYLGGMGGDYGLGIAVDSKGNAYVTGESGSPNFPTKNPASSRVSILDAFVTKLNSTGSAIVYSTYLGSDGEDAGNDIAVDAAGNAYVTGYVTPNDTRDIFDEVLGDVFVAKLDTTGSQLLYAVTFGGAPDEYFTSGSDSGKAIAVDSNGNAYVTGDTDAEDFPTTPGALQTKYGSLGDAFVTKLNATGKIVYSTFLGGSDDFETSGGIAVDPAGNAYVTGRTNTSGYGGNFPTTANAFQRSYDGTGSAFVTKINPSLSGRASLVYSTFLSGTTGNESGNDIAVDSTGNAYITGYTTSTDFPTTIGAFQNESIASPSCFYTSGSNGIVIDSDTFGNNVPGGSTVLNYNCDDVFVTKLNPAGSALVYSTYLGGTSLEVGYGIAVDSAGNAYVTGRAYTDFPTMNAFPRPTGNTNDAFVTKLNAAGSALVYSIYLGGGGDESGNDIAVDSAGNAYVVGTTSSSTAANNFPTTNGALQRTFGGGTLSPNSDAFVTKIAPR